MKDMQFLEHLSIDQLNQYASYCRWLLLIPAIITILLSVVSVKISDRILALQVIEKAKSAEIQRKYQSQISELKKGQEPRILSEEQKNKLRDALNQSFPQGIKEEIVIASAMLDPESESYGKQIEDALSNSSKNKAFTPMGCFTFQGIRIFSRGESASEIVKCLQTAFQTAGITYSTEFFKIEACPIQPTEGVFIFVGKK